MKKSKNSRRKFSSKFKSKVALEALKERSTIAELALKYELHGSQISLWKRQFLEGMEQIFSEPGQDSEDVEKEKEALYCKIGKLEMERDFLKKSLSKLGWTTN